MAATAPSRRKRRRNATLEEKADWAKRFAESGLRQREFCRQHGLVLTTLQRWLGQVQGARQSSTKAKAAFMEVKVTPPLSVSRWAAELCRTDGATLRLAHDVPPELLEQLLRSC
jgi:transposase-like protein